MAYQRNPEAVLRKGREKSVGQKHPWIFSGSIAKVSPGAKSGDTIEVLADNGEWLARGGYNPYSKIPIRIWTWTPEQTIDAHYINDGIKKALAYRRPLEYFTNAYRIVNAESDGLPGMIVDRYAEYAVVQLLTAGAERWRSEIVDALRQLDEFEGIYERSDVDIREKEQLPIQKGWLSGKLPAHLIPFREGDWVFLANIMEGHKTGFYLDQRDNRKLVQEVLRRSNKAFTLLNMFSYTGAFAVTAFSAGAQSVVCVDSSRVFLEESKEMLRQNKSQIREGDFIKADAFQELRRYRDQNRKFDAIILDPPKFVFTQKDLRNAARAYKDLNWLAMRLLVPGGLLFTFSCSGLMPEELFQKILFSAALDSGREVQFVRRMGQSEDHPTLATFPEGQYLKGFICRVT